MPAVACLPPVPCGRVFAGLETYVEEMADLLISGPEPPQVVTILGPPGHGDPSCVLPFAR